MSSPINRSLGGAEAPHFPRQCVRCVVLAVLLVFAHQGSLVSVSPLEPPAPTRCPRGAAPPPVLT